MLGQDRAAAFEVKRNIMRLADAVREMHEDTPLLRDELGIEHTVELAPQSVKHAAFIHENKRPDRTVLRVNSLLRQAAHVITDQRAQRVLHAE